MLSSRKVLALGLAVLAVFGLPNVAVAQDTTAEDIEETPAISATNLALAEQVVAEAFPIETREEMFAQVSRQLNAQIMQSVSGQISDEGTVQILKEWQADFAVEQDVITARHLPMLMDALTRSYAVIFTETELRDILVFVSTDSGRAYLTKSTDIISEPNFAAANQIVMDEMMAQMPKQIDILMERIVAYQSSQEETED